ncbi:MAG: hypothetical protein JNJ61_25785 [Anaerolineae bacterium]|nr:hypothetical protein [Anaerolineae bacterium]
MTNQLYPLYREAALAGNADFDADTMVMILARTSGYTFSTAHDFLNDVPGGSRASTTSALTSKTVTQGTADAADPVFTSVASGAACDCVILTESNGTESTSQLYAYYDTGTGIPITPNGGNINVTISGSGLFTL